MKGYPRALAALLASAIVSACSGGTSTGSLTPSTSPAHKFAWNGKMGHVRMRFAVPRHASALRNGKKAHYLPATVTHVTFSLVDVEGVPTGSPGTPTPFDFTIATSVTSGNPSCNSNPDGSGFLCSADEPAPAADDTWTIVAKDTTSGWVLSESMVSVNVLPDTTTTGYFTLNPVAASLRFFAGTCGGYTYVSGAWKCTGGGFDNGTGTPVWNGSAYTCPTPADGGCYDPLLNDEGTAVADSVTLNVLDNDNNIITPGANGTTISGSPNVPIYLQTGTDPSPGGGIGLHVICQDPDVAWLQASPPDGAPPLSYSTLKAASEPTADLANGAHSAAGIVQYLGPGLVDSTTFAGFTSPVTGEDYGSTSDVGTDFNGAQYQVWGNDGRYLNYDGGGNGGGPYNLASLDYCNAYIGSNIAGTSYYIGLAQGTIGWGTNAKHAHRRR